MVAFTQTLRVTPEVQEKVNKWLRIEAEDECAMSTNVDAINVSFTTIDDAFRFRLQFDDYLLAD